MRSRIYKADNFYHICNKSIANYKIFKDLNNGKRFYQALAYYNNPKNKVNLGMSLINNPDYQPNLLIPVENSYLKFLNFCIMPDHYHLVVKVMADDVLSKYINDVENSFSRFFNLRYNRKGPIWQSRFKAIRIKSNEQLLHVIRYVALNPTTSSLANKPEDWFFSGYRFLISDPVYLSKYLTEISISKPLLFKQFVENNLDYQRQLKKIKKLILE